MSRAQVNRRLSGTVKVVGKIDVTQMLTLSSYEGVNEECRLAVNNHNVAQKYAGSACSECKVKVKKRRLTGGPSLRQ